MSPGQSGPPAVRKHLMVPGQPRPPQRDSMSLGSVQSWVMSTLITHHDPAPVGRLVVAAYFSDRSTPRSACW